MKKAILLLPLPTIFVAGIYGQPEINRSPCPPDAYYPLGSFVDSISIGRPGYNKVRIEKYVSDDDSCVRLFFYTKNKYPGNGQPEWLFCNQFIDDDYASNSNPEIADFNNDGYKDFTYHSVEGVRGGNEIRKLFIYDPEADDFVLIKNSEDYANLSYNKELDCINSVVLYSCNATQFLKLQADSSHLVANVELCEDGTLTVTQYDKQGNETSEKHETNKRFDMWKSFTNYDPPEQ